jgi:hypothetical protein
MTDKETMEHLLALRDAPAPIVRLAAYTLLGIIANQDEEAMNLFVGGCERAAVRGLENDMAAEAFREMSGRTDLPC